MKQQIKPIYIESLRYPSYSPTAPSSSRVFTMCPYGLRLRIMEELSKTTKNNSIKFSRRGANIHLYSRHISKPLLASQFFGAHRPIHEGGNYCLVHLIYNYMTKCANLKGSSQQQHNPQSVTKVESFAKPDKAS